jgi:hypothetical protein
LVLAGALFVVLNWAFGNFLWDVLVQWLETSFGIKEADVIAAVLSVIVPGGVVILALMAMYGLVRREYADHETPKADEKASWRTRLNAVCSNTFFQAGAALVVLVFVAGLLGSSSRLWPPGEPATIIFLSEVPALVDNKTFAVNVDTANSSTKTWAKHVHVATGFTSGQHLQDPTRPINNYSLLMLATLKENRETAQDDVAPRTKKMYTAYGKKTLYDDNKAENQDLYLLVFIEYQDETLRKDRWWVAEGCWRLWPNNSMQRCDIRNGKPYVRD